MGITEKQPLRTAMLCVLMFISFAQSAELSVSPRLIAGNQKVRITVRDVDLPAGATITLSGKVGKQPFTRTDTLKNAQRSFSTSLSFTGGDKKLRIPVEATLTINGVTQPQLQPNIDTLNVQAIQHKYSSIMSNPLKYNVVPQYELLPPGKRLLQAAKMLCHTKLLLAPERLSALKICQLLEKFESLQTFKDEQEYATHLQSCKGINEGAYVSNIDGSAQPFKYYLPHKPAPDGGYPLIILLHGYVPSYNRLSWMDIDRVMGEMSEQLGCAFLLPFGRGNTDFLTIGEVDVLDSITALSAICKIDRTRLYLSGYSMGGSGVWAMLCHHPDKFAAARIWQGRVDYFLWYEEKLAALGLSRDNYPPYKKALILADNPVDMYENILEIPIRVSHPKDDNLVKPAQTTKMLDILARAGHKDFQQLPAPSGMMHWFFTSEIDKPESYRWMLDYKLPENPPKVTYNTFSTYYTGAWWFKCGLPDKWTELMQQQAEQTNGEIKWLKAENVGYKNLPAHKPLKYGNTAGPVKNALAAPFICVYEKPTQRDNPTVATINLAKFIRDWRAFAHSTPRIKSVDRLTPDDIANFNLFIFGSTQSNPLLAKMADKLPFVIDGQNYGVPGHTVEAQGNGFFACYPNPLNPERLIIILDGLYYGEGLSFNHKWDLVPDYIVYTPNRDPEDGSNSARLAGFFDSKWKFSPELCWEKAVPALPERKSAMPSFLIPPPPKPE